MNAQHCAPPAKRVQVRPWLPPPSTVQMPSSSAARRRAGSLTLDTATPSASSLSTSASHTRSPSPARRPTIPASTPAPPLKLEVLDVTCSAVALSVFTPSTSSSPAATTKPPSISILLDRRPWPHVAHAGSAPADLGLETTVIVYGLDPNREYEIGFEVSDGAQMTAAATVGDTTGDPSATSIQEEADLTGEDSTPSRRPSFDSNAGDAMPSDDPTQFSLNLDGPPPPYSPSPIPPAAHQSATIPPVSVPITASTLVTTSSSLASPSSSSSAQRPRYPHSRSSSAENLHAASDDDDSTLSENSPYATESQLRSALKSLRANSKRTEQSLSATLSSLRKTVEKAAKEDQRARSRIVALEDAIRKAEKVETEVRGQETNDVAERLKEVEEEERRVAEVLEEWKRGGGKRPEGAPARSGGSLSDERRNSVNGEEDRNLDPTANAAQDAPGSFGTGGGTSNLAELAKELDALNKAIEAVEKEKADKAGEVLKALEREMTVVEGELIQLDREDAHRAVYGPPGALLPIMPVHPGLAPNGPLSAPPTQAPNQTAGGPFNFRWRRGGGAAGASTAQAQTQQQQAQDPRSFGRFFRRNNPNSAVSAPAPLPLLSLDGSTLSNGSTPNSASSASAGNSVLNLLPTSSATPPFDDLIPSQVHLQPPSANPSERFAAQQQFAQAHQAQALWAQAQARSNSNPSQGQSVDQGGLGRRRAGSLNSVSNNSQRESAVFGSDMSGARSSSSTSFANAQMHSSGAQSARTSFDESHPSYERSGASFAANVKSERDGDKDKTTSSPIGLGNVLRSARSRSDSTLGGESTKGSIESASSGKTESAGRGGPSAGPSGKGKSWARLGTWSQVVGKGTKRGEQASTKGVEGDDALTEEEDGRTVEQ